MQTAVARAKVMAGMDFLDSVDPGWEERVDRDNLDLSSPVSCVLGQTQGNFSVGMRQLELTDQEATSYGFLHLSHGSDESDPIYTRTVHQLDYQDLTNAWSEAIGDRIEMKERILVEA